jgi:hypothetical protein
MLLANPLPGVKLAQMYVPGLQTMGIVEPSFEPSNFRPFAMLEAQEIPVFEGNWVLHHDSGMVTVESDENFARALKQPPLAEVQTAFAVSGYYRFYLLDENDQVLEHDDAGNKIDGGIWHKNLLLDKFMDGLAVNPFNTLRNYLAVGTGSNEVQRLGGALTASQAAATVTSSAAFFLAGDVGSDVVFSTGERAKITAFVNTTTVTVAVSQNVAATTFRVEFVNQTALQTEVQRTSSNGGFGDVSNYSAGGNLHTTDYTISRVVTLAANQTLTEFGFSEATSSAGGVNIRQLFRDAGGNPIPIVIASGKKVRVDHRFLGTVPFITETKEFSYEERDAANNTLPAIQAASNATPIQITTATAHGYSTGQKLELYGITGNTGANGVFTITVTGATTFTLQGSVGNGVYNAGTGRIARRIACQCTFFTNNATSSTSNPYTTFEPNNAFVRVGSRASLGSSAAPNIDISFLTGHGLATYANDAYVAGSFSRRKRATLTEAEGNGDIFAWVLSQGGASSYAHGYKVVLDPEKIVKLNTHTLELSLVVTWRRG